jgi:hypothetical protein
MRQFNITVEHEDRSATQHLNVPETAVSSALAGTLIAPDVIGYSVRLVRLAGAEARPRTTPLIARRVHLSGTTFVPDVVVLLVLAYAHMRRDRFEREQKLLDEAAAKGESVAVPGHQEWFNRGDLLSWLDTFPLARDLVDTPSARGGRLSAYLAAMARTGLLLPPSDLHDVGWRLP